MSINKNNFPLKTNGSTLDIPRIFNLERLFLRGVSLPLPQALRLSLLKTINSSRSFYSQLPYPGSVSLSFFVDVFFVRLMMFFDSCRRLFSFQQLLLAFFA